VLTACLAVTVGSVLPLFLTSALGVQIRDAMGLTDAGFGVVVTMHHLSGMALGLAVGRQADRIGWQRAVRLSGLIAAGSLFGIAVLARTPVVLGALLMLGGIGHASAMASVNLAIVRQVPPHRYALVFGLKQAAPTAGFLIAGLSLPVIALTLGWRWTFAGGAVMTLASVLLVPASGGRLGRQGQEKASETVAAPGRIRQPVTGLLALAGGAGAMSVSALAAFLVIAHVGVGMEPATAGLLVAVCSVVGIVIRIVAGAYTDHTGSNGLGLVALMLAIGCLGYVGLATGLRPVLFVGSVVAFGAGWGWPGLFHFAVVSMNPQAPAAATGLTHAAISTGSAAGPLAFGFLAEAGGYGRAWAMVAIAAGLASLLVLLARAMVVRTLGSSPDASVVPTLA
jgi:predicted MFS family arabinose efflux permease